MKQVSILLLCILLWANVAFAVQTHQISQEERKSLPWWDKSKPVRPAVAERPWWDKERIVRPPSPIDAERSEKYANNRGKQKTTNSVRMSIKLDKLED
jgi:hypothetical protein